MAWWLDGVMARWPGFPRACWLNSIAPFMYMTVVCVSLGAARRLQVDAEMLFFKPEAVLHLFARRGLPESSFLFARQFVLGEADLA